MDTRNSSFLGRPAFATLLIGLGLVLFGPPLVGIPARAGGAALLIYLFAAWAVLIAVLLVRTRALAPKARHPEPGQSGERP